MQEEANLPPSASSVSLVPCFGNTTFRVFQPINQWRIRRDHFKKAECGPIASAVLVYGLGRYQRPRMLVLDCIYTDSEVKLLLTALVLALSISMHAQHRYILRTSRCSATKQYLSRSWRSTEHLELYTSAALRRGSSHPSIYWSATQDQPRFRSPFTHGYLGRHQQHRART